MSYLASSSYVDDVPFHVLVVVLEVNAMGDDNFFTCIRAVTHVLQIHFIAIVGPCAKLQEALLHIKGKVLYVYWAVTLVYSWRLPKYPSVMKHCGFGVQCDDKVSVGTVIINVNNKSSTITKSYLQK